MIRRIILEPGHNAAAKCVIRVERRNRGYQFRIDCWAGKKPLRPIKM